mmetsp:Transcript_11901/g.17741  ORF Transcript_11901/g.17741 Transcript_11901/m.17741 type:complete len:236 (-) Transcript_11901:64-771(-)
MLSSGLEGKLPKSNAVSTTKRDRPISLGAGGELRKAANPPKIISGKKRDKGVHIIEKPAEKTGLESDHSSSNAMKSNEVSATKSSGESKSLASKLSEISKVKERVKKALEKAAAVSKSVSKAILEAPENLSSTKPEKTEADVIPQKKKRKLKIKNKKMAGLVSKWAAVQREAAESDIDPYERRKARERQEIEDWKKQQVATGASASNENFIPVGESWKHRLSSKKSSSSLLGDDW